MVMGVRVESWDEMGRATAVRLRLRLRPQRIGLSYMERGREDSN
jgi:hypothetical protein